MSFVKENYPENWKEFSKFIRFERAGNKCEKCGVKNGIYKVYLKDNVSVWFLDERPEEHPNIKSVTKICLTVAHLDYEGGICQCKKQTGKKCAIPSHVLALCNACHLALDRPHHVAVRRKNFINKKDAERPLFAFTVMDFG